MIIIGWKFDLAKLDGLVNQNTGERFPKILYGIVKYFLCFVMAAVVLIALLAEFENPLELPWWGLMFGWALMLFPILLVLSGFCTEKKRVLCCLMRFTAKSYVIEYEIEEEKNNPPENEQKEDGPAAEIELAKL